MCRNPTVSLRSGITRKETVFQLGAGYRRVEGQTGGSPAGSGAPKGLTRDFKSVYCAKVRASTCTPRIRSSIVKG